MKLHFQQELTDRFTDLCGDADSTLPLLFPILPAEESKRVWDLVEQTTKTKTTKGDPPTTISNSNNNDSSSNKRSRSSRAAAVLVPLVQITKDNKMKMKKKESDEKHSNYEYHMLFTRRAMTLRSQPGQICFPGGHAEEQDNGSLVTTALRECQEELVSDTNVVVEWTILGEGTALPSPRGVPVTPVIALCQTSVPIVLDDDDDDDDINNNNDKIDDAARSLSSVFPGNPQEVDHVFSHSVAELLELEEVELQDSRFGKLDMPVYNSPHGRIWGLTALMVRPLLHKWLKPVVLRTAVTVAPEDSSMIKEDAMGTERDRNNNTLET